MREAMDVIFLVDILEATVEDRTTKNYLKNQRNNYL